MTVLTRGANAVLTDPTLDIAVTGARPGTVDLLVFQLGPDRQVRSDADMVFFNQPASPEGAVRLDSGDRVRVDTAGLPPDVDRLAVAVALDDGVPGSLRDVAGLGVAVAEHSAAAEGLTTERAAVLVEVYRRGGVWKVLSVSQGWAEGLAGLAREHGVDVGGDPAPPVVEDPAPPPVEETAPPHLRAALDMRKKEVRKVLLTKGAEQVRARVVLVIDKTGSMYQQYLGKVVHRVVERMVPVAVQLDDDGTLECYLYARSFVRLPDLRVPDLDTWPASYLFISGTHGGIDYEKIGAANDEIPIMTEIVSTLSAGDPVPTLVLFFTDGGFSKRGPIRALMRQAAHLPAFWQFVGLGRADYGTLEKLDDLRGRVVDNAGFFALDDIDAVTDAELYRRLLGEFPDWLRAARARGIVG